MSRTSPTQRTLKALRDEGYTAGICERFITAGANRKFGNRVDLFGLFDIIAMHPLNGIIGVQCFTTAWREHEELFLEERKDATRCWLMAGGQIELWGWRKLLKKRGGKQKIWVPRIKEVLAERGRLILNEIDYG